VYVVGAGNSAGQAAAHLADHAHRVTLLVRGGAVTASMSDYLVRQLERTDNVHIRPHTRVERVDGEWHLETLTLRTRGGVETVPADALFILIGAIPHTDWLPRQITRSDRGYILTDTDLPQPPSGAARSPLRYESSLPGVFAVGDVRHGSVKRVASAVGEGAVCVTSIHRHLKEPEAHPNSAQPSS
jgi:thioredoxin reductase (NADPH)